MLQEDERRDLLERVADFTEAKPTRLKTILGPDHIRRIQTDAIPEEYAGYVIRYCERSGWIERPPLIINLLKKWDQHIPFASAIARLESTPPPRFFLSNRPWDALLVALNLPFLNRTTTRVAVERFSYPLVSVVNPAGARVLVVNGPDLSGKSFTYDYILYVNSIVKDLNFKIAWIDYRKQLTGRFGPEQLIRSLLQQIDEKWDGTLPELDVEQPARWLLELTQLLASKVLATNTTWFVILDHFDAPNVPRETLDLIQRIAAAATGEDPLAGADDSLRLVLLGFNELIVNYKNRVITDKIKPVQRDDVSKYFVNYARYVAKAINPADLEKIVDSIVTPDIDNHPDRTQLIAGRCIERASTIIGIIA